MSRVTIAIQARMTSDRLPGKALMKINGIPMIERVLMAAEKSAAFINNGRRDDIKVNTALLVPENDELADIYFNRKNTTVITGSEEDVLSRYTKCLEYFDADYICRITGDCPLIPPYVITKHIVNAVKYNYDFVTNAHPEVRMSPDGYDCEVISRDALLWADETAISKPHREHVTQILVQRLPERYKSACVLSHLDLSSLKISVDTEKDLEYVRNFDMNVLHKITKAKDKNVCDGTFML